jgi:hypothetical protein
LFDFWVVSVNIGFISCYDPQEEVLVISDFIQQFLAGKHMPLLLLISEQLRTNFTEIHKVMFIAIGKNYSSNNSLGLISSGQYLPESFAGCILL